MNSILAQTPGETGSDQLLTEVVGHQKVIRQLQLLVERTKLGHALLFTGPEGIGKRTIARALATKLLSQRKQPGETDPVALMRAGTHPDFHLLKKEVEKREISVDGVRALCNSLILKPYCAPYVVAVIDNAHQMNIAASNALLKVLEEPPSSSFIILVSHAPNRLPETILSRCHQFHFGALSDSECTQLRNRLFGELLADDAALERHLRELSPNSLGELGLDPFYDPRSLQLQNERQLRTHLSSIAEESARLRKQLRRVLEGGSPGEAVVLAAELAAEKDGLPLVWRMLFEELRRRLLTAPSDKRYATAELLLSTLHRETLAKERTLSPAVHLSELLATAGSISSA